MKKDKTYRFETLAVHAGHGVDPATGAVVDPIHLSTTFEREPDGSYPRGYLYSRNGNPNRNGLETALAALECGEACATFGSGLAAVTAIFQGLQPGDHVLAPLDIYHGTANVLKHLFAKWQVSASFIDMTQLDFGHDQPGVVAQEFVDFPQMAFMPYVMPALVDLSTNA